MPGRVAPHDGGRTQGRAAGEAQEGAGEAGGDEIDQVVAPGARPAEIAVALAAVADHAVQRVDRLVGEDAGQPRHGGPEQRGHHSVREVLGQRFDGGPTNARGIEPLGIAADDHGHGAATRGKARTQSSGDIPHMVDQAALGEKGAHQQALEQPAGGQLPGQPTDQDATGYRRTCYRSEQDNAREPPAPRPGERIEPPSFELGDTGADQNDWMRDVTIEPSRLAEQRVGHQGHEESGRVSCGRMVGHRQLPGRRRSRLGDGPQRGLPIRRMPSSG